MSVAMGNTVTASSRMTVQMQGIKLRDIFISVRSRTSVHHRIKATGKTMRFMGLADTGRGPGMRIGGVIILTVHAIISALSKLAAMNEFEVMLDEE